jgi:tRNA (mo5U34)-methyltransferase
VTGGYETALRARIEALGPWFHNLDLNGVATAPEHFLGDYPRAKFRRFAASLPSDLSGCSVLDIGCNAGFCSIEMKRRGAHRVVGIDSDERYLAQARFAAELCEVDIEFHQLSVYDAALPHRRFERVLFMDVSYHLRRPLLALDPIREHAAADLMIIQWARRGSRFVASVESGCGFSDTGHFDQSGYPKLHFIEHHYANDPTNWWIPNRTCVEAMLRSSGFEIMSRPEKEVYRRRRAVWRPRRAPRPRAGGT